LIPTSLIDALRPITVVVGHYGSGKTNFTLNVALDLKAAGRNVAVVDLDIVNPYFRASEHRVQLEAAGVQLVAPVYSEAATSLDVPSLTGLVDTTLRDASENTIALIDAGGDDVGATALGRYARVIREREHAVLYVANRFRNLVADTNDALQNLREIEQASHLSATVLVNNSHLKEATNGETIVAGIAYARELSELCGLEVVCTTVPANLNRNNVENAYQIAQHVRNPWE